MHGKIKKVFSDELAKDSIDYENLKSVTNREMELFEQDENKIKDIMEIIDLVCEQSLVEPTFEEIKDVITDTQKMQIMAEAQGNVNAAIPSIRK